VAQLRRRSSPFSDTFHLRLFRIDAIALDSCIFRCWIAVTEGGAAQRRSLNTIARLNQNLSFRPQGNPLYLAGVGLGEGLSVELNDPMPLGRYGEVPRLLRRSQLS
jgi:hypothetical protein